MAAPIGSAELAPLRVDFDCRLEPEFHGRNTRHRLAGLLRQPVFGRLAGHDNAERLARGPTKLP